MQWSAIVISSLLLKKTIDKTNVFKLDDLFKVFGILWMDCVFCSMWSLYAMCKNIQVVHVYRSGVY